MTERSCLTIVLAAGEGTRMRATRPKVLHSIGFKPLIWHVMDAVRPLQGRCAVVIGPGLDQVGSAARDHTADAEIFIQSERRGTAHAVLAARDAIARGADDIFVVFPDTPLIAS